MLLGVASGDSEEDAEFIADRIVGMRIFADEAGKMNLALAQVDGALLVVSQFTLHADTSQAAAVVHQSGGAGRGARGCTSIFSRSCRARGVKVENG